MKQLEFNFNKKNKYFDSDVERNLFYDFCKMMYSENGRERRIYQEKPYKNLLDIFARIGIFFIENGRNN